jgi:hypothetical protein
MDALLASNVLVAMIAFNEEMKAELPKIKADIAEMLPMIDALLEVVGI